MHVQAFKVRKRVDRAPALPGVQACDQQIVAARDQVVEKKDATLSSKDDNIARLTEDRDQAVREKDAMLQFKDDQLHAKDSQIRAKDIQLIAKDEQLREKDAGAREQEQNHRAVVTDKDGEVHAALEARERASSQASRDLAKCEALQGQVTSLKAEHKVDMKQAAVEHDRRIKVFISEKEF
ncbi:hypothetical protein T484DRAFT_1820221 [Baffinella frigidus]|nr:hypothetical protein T484DRAFT_1820221 [Cryptophyta sp. CCMP2293]